MVYLLHFIDPETGKTSKYQHAGHYLGWTRWFDRRVAHHRAGSGSRLLRAVCASGLDFVVSRRWHEADGNFEQWLKRHNQPLSVYCPVCKHDAIVMRSQKGNWFSRLKPKRRVRYDENTRKQLVAFSRKGESRAVLCLWHHDNGRKGEESEE